MAVGITKLRNVSNGSVILGSENRGEMERLKTTIHDKLGENFKITEPKIKINVGKEEMKLEDLIDDHEAERD